MDGSKEGFLLWVPREYVENKTMECNFLGSGYGLYHFFILRWGTGGYCQRLHWHSVMLDRFVCIQRNLPHCNMSGRNRIIDMGRRRYSFPILAGTNGKHTEIKDNVSLYATRDTLPVRMQRGKRHAPRHYLQGHWKKLVCGTSG
jgi:hypothetical protein